jgi:hypothetical protein
MDRNEIGKEYMEKEGGLTGIGRLERKQRVTEWVAGVRRSRSAAAPRARPSSAPPIAILAPLPLAAVGESLGRAVH